MRDLVMSFIGEDRPGLVQRLSDIVAEHRGNWEESRMVRLAGQFAGTARIAVAPEDVAGLAAALEAYGELTIVVREDDNVQGSGQRRLHLNIVGPDRSGILRDVTSELASREISVVEMSTQVFAAPMSGVPTFSADAEVEAPDTLDLVQLNETLDDIGERLGVDILLEDVPASS